MFVMEKLKNNELLKILEVQYKLTLVLNCFDSFDKTIELLILIIFQLKIELSKNSKIKQI